MILHFIFLVKEGEREQRQFEYSYVKRMAKFFGAWIKEKFGHEYEIVCDEMITRPTGLLQRLDTHTLLRDHEQRGSDAYHFYLTHFRPLWTDCTCEGYHAENFGMVLWQRPKEDDELFLAEKNCTAVSYIILCEMLRKLGRKKYGREVQDIWTKHLFEQLAFEQYDEDYQRTDGKPAFLAMDTADLDLPGQHFVTE